MDASHPFHHKLKVIKASSPVSTDKTQHLHPDDNWQIGVKGITSEQELAYEFQIEVMLRKLYDMHWTEAEMHRDWLLAHFWRIEEVRELGADRQLSSEEA